MIYLILHFFCLFRGKSLLESWDTTFILDLSQTSCACALIVLIWLSSAHVILKYIRQRLRVDVSREEKWLPQDSKSDLPLRKQTFKTLLSSYSKQE